MALPSLWAGAESEDIVHNLLDGPVKDGSASPSSSSGFNGPGGGSATEVMRMAIPFRSGGRDPQIEVAIREATRESAVELALPVFQ